MSVSKHALDVAINQSARDLGCTAEDLTGTRNRCVPVRERGSGARVWLPEPPILHMVSYGSCVVALAAPDLSLEISRLLAGGGPAWKYFQPAFTQRAAELAAFIGRRVYLALDTCFLWSGNAALRPELANAFTFRILTAKDFSSLRTPTWENALSADRPHLDVLGVGAYDGDRLVGLAGCSEECPEMWQIGIDVLPEYRRHGLATILVQRLAALAEEHGRIPYYTAASANIPSLRTAVAAGFIPTWAQLTAMPSKAS